MRRILLFTLLAAAACARGGQPIGESGPEVVERRVEVISGGSAGGGPAQVIGGDEAALREFIGRALDYPSPEATDGVTVLIGALPEGLPLELPIPEGSRVVGSTVRGSELGGTEIILDVDMPPEGVLGFYQEELLRAGWEEAPEQPYGGGFVSASWPTATYCLNQDEAQIYLSAFEMPGKGADVRLNIQSPVQYSACDPQVYGPYDEGSAVIPELITPQGTVVESGGSSSGDGMADTSASLRTDLSPAELVESYADQLREVGWTQIAREAAEELAWSTWSKADEEGRKWAGMLLVAANPVVPDRVFAWFRVERAD